MNLTPVLGRIEPMYGIAACSKYLRNPTKAGGFSHQQQATVTHITGTHGGTPPSPFFWFQFIHFWWACLFDLSVCGSFRFWCSDCWLFEMSILSFPPMLAFSSQLKFHAWICTPTWLFQYQIYCYILTCHMSISVLGFLYICVSEKRKRTKIIEASIGTTY